MNREVRGKGRTGLSRQLLGLEASNLPQRQEKQERWRSGEKARGRQTDERGGKGKRRSVCCWWGLYWSLISDGQEEGQG